MTKLFSILTILLLSFSVIADDKPLADPSQEAYARSLMKEIRCLVCQNQSIEDSSADLAVDLRNIVREQVATGKNHEEIKNYLVARYGDWILLKPPVRFDTIFLWGSPVLILMVIFLAVMMNRKKAKTPAAFSADEQAKLDDILGGESE